MSLWESIISPVAQTELGRQLVAQPKGGVTVGDRRDRPSLDGLKSL
jgi:hypothetical protein